MDEIWSRVNAIDAISCVMWDESGSRRWRAEQLAKVVQWSSAHHWNRLFTAESVGLSNKDSGVGAPAQEFPPVFFFFKKIWREGSLAEPRKSWW